MNSSLSSRPLRLWFVKETDERILEEKARLDKERKELKPYEWAEGVTFEFQGWYCMCDMKVSNTYLGNRAMSVCPICKAKPRDVNDLDRTFGAIPRALCELSLAILHFSIRTFEHLIKIGAKNKAGVQEYYARGAVKQAKVKLALDRIRKNFKETLGLSIFEPRDGGKGSSNDGNTGRLSKFYLFLGELFSLKIQIYFCFISLVSNLLYNLNLTFLSL